MGHHSQVEQGHGRVRVELPWGLSQGAYGDLIRAVGAFASLFGLVSEVSPRSRRGKQVLDALDAYLSATVMVSSWPGTTAATPTCVNRYLVTPGSLDVITANSDSFWDWVSPSMPADLHFLHSDGSVALGSTSCEQFAWLEVGHDELAAVQRAVPGVRLGVFDPFDEFDRWLAGYGADLGEEGEVVVAERQEPGNRWRTVKVTSQRWSAGLALTMTGHVRWQVRRGGRTSGHALTVETSDELRGAFTRFYEEIQKNGR